MINSPVIFDICSLVWASSCFFQFLCQILESLLHQKPFLRLTIFFHCFISKIIFFQLFNLKQFNFCRDLGLLHPSHPLDLPYDGVLASLVLGLSLENGGNQKIPNCVRLSHCQACLRRERSEDRRYQNPDGPDAFSVGFRAQLNHKLWRGILVNNNCLSTTCH